MEITEIRTYRCSDGARNAVFLHVFTDEGITGVGEPYTVGPDEGIVGTIENVTPWFVGQDPSRIEWLMRRARNTMRFPLGQVAWAALSGIEQALWDIAGKAAGVPVYMLLGGKFRDKVRAYHAIYDPDPYKLADHALALKDEGYTAFKTNPYPEDWRAKPWNQVVREAGQRLAIFRQRVGEEVDIGLDVHATLLNPMQAYQLAKSVEPYRPMFIEEPVRPEHVPSTARLREQIRVPVATGENLYDLTEFITLFDAQAVDIIQPDLCVCGGFLEAKKIAAAAEANYVTVAPHNPLGLLSTAVSVHLAAAIPNFVILEYHGDHAKPKARFIDDHDPWAPVEGYFQLPTKPGIGMELNLEVIENSPPVHWNRGFPNMQDGSPGFI